MQTPHTQRGPRAGAPAVAAAQWPRPCSPARPAPEARTGECTHAHSHTHTHTHTRACAPARAAHKRSHACTHFLAVPLSCSRSRSLALSLSLLLSLSRFLAFLLSLSLSLSSPSSLLSLPSLPLPLCNIALALALARSPTTRPPRHGTAGGRAGVRRATMGRPRTTSHACLVSTSSNSSNTACTTYLKSHLRVCHRVPHVTPTRPRRSSEHVGACLLACVCCAALRGRPQQEQGTPLDSHDALQSEELHARGCLLARRRLRFLLPQQLREPAFQRVRVDCAADTIIDSHPSIAHTLGSMARGTRRAAE